MKKILFVFFIGVCMAVNLIPIHSRGIELSNGGTAFLYSLYPGDVNGDGFITKDDAQIIIDSCIELIPPLTGEQKDAADMDGNGVVTSLDAQMIINLVLGKDEWELTFNPSGGTVSRSSKSVRTGQTYGELPTPSRDNYQFIGWFTPQEVLVIEDSTVMLTADRTLYARWKYVPPPTYIVTFAPVRGSVYPKSMDWKNAQFIILYENFRIYFVNFGYTAKILTFFSIYSILQAKRTRKNCVFGGCIGKMAETPPLWCVRHARLYGNLAQGF